MGKKGKGKTITFAVTTKTRKESAKEKADKEKEEREKKERRQKREEKFAEEGETFAPFDFGGFLRGTAKEAVSRMRLLYDDDDDEDEESSSKKKEKENKSGSAEKEEEGSNKKEGPKELLHVCDSSEEEGGSSVEEGSSMYEISSSIEEEDSSEEEDTSEDDDMIAKVQNQIRKFLFGLTLSASGLPLLKNKKEQHDYALPSALVERLYPYFSKGDLTNKTVFDIHDWIEQKYYLREAKNICEDPDESSFFLLSKEVAKPKREAARKKVIRERCKLQMETEGVHIYEFIELLADWWRASKKGKSLDAFCSCCGGAYGSRNKSRTVHLAAAAKKGKTAAKATAAKKKEEAPLIFRSIGYYDDDVAVFFYSRNELSPHHREKADKAAKAAFDALSIRIPKKQVPNHYLIVWCRNAEMGRRAYASLLFLMQAEFREATHVSGNSRFLFWVVQFLLSHPTGCTNVTTMFGHYNLYQKREPEAVTTYRGTDFDRPLHYLSSLLTSIFVVRRNSYVTHRDECETCGLLAEHFCACGELSICSLSCLAAIESHECDEPRICFVCGRSLPASVWSSSSSSARVIRCKEKGCDRVVYCSTQCRRYDWDHCDHKAECTKEIQWRFPCGCLDEGEGDACEDE